MNVQMLSFVTYAGIASALCAFFLGLGDLFRRRSNNTRLRYMPEFAVRRSAGMFGRFDSWFARTLYLAGWDVKPLAGALLLVLCGLGVGGTVLLLTDLPGLSLAAAVAGGAAMLGYMIYAKNKRVRAFHQQFPAALSLLARAVRAGESLDQAISLVGESSPEPVGIEFRRCAKQLEMGLGLPAVMDAMAWRLNLMDVRIFANTLAIHRDAGGHVSETLERLAQVIRDRIQYHRQLKSITGAGRFSVLLIAALGPLLFAYMFFFQPEYSGTLLQDPIGRGLLIFAVVSEIIGLFWVSKLVKADY